MENVFEHEGARGHEIVFAADIELPDAVFADEAEINFTDEFEGGSFACRVRWIRLGDLDRDGPARYPAGLKAHLASRRQSAFLRSENTFGG